MLFCLTAKAATANAAHTNLIIKHRALSGAGDDVNYLQGKRPAGSKIYFTK